jgi:hypothetical protein
LVLLVQLLHVLLCLCIIPFSMTSDSIDNPLHGAIILFLNNQIIIIPVMYIEMEILILHCKIPQFARIYHRIPIANSLGFMVIFCGLIWEWSQISVILFLVKHNINGWFNHIHNNVKSNKSHLSPINQYVTHPKQ